MSSLPSRLADASRPPRRLIVAGALALLLAPVGTAQDTAGTRPAAKRSRPSDDQPVATTGPVPIAFHPLLNYSVSQPTAAVFGPDGRLYVTGRDGRVWAMTFDEDYALLDLDELVGVSGLSNHEILGIAINPFDPPDPVRLYVGHAALFNDGGSTPPGPSDYTGQISILEGPDFDTPIPLVTNLPTSNHDHAINGMEFDHDGDLLVAIGGNTNAGVQHPNIGDIPESPLSGAIVKVLTSKPADDFHGTIEYLETVGGAPNTDQRDGDIVDVAPGVDLVVHATGFRNTYDIAYTTKGRLYATDNGPNVGFGAESTGPATEGPHPGDPDELMYVERGSYYGHPNRNRGRYDARENVYHRVTTGASIPETFKQSLAVLSVSTNGIDEYRSDVFDGQLRGRILVQRWNSAVTGFELGANGRTVVDNDPLASTGSLGLVTGPDGVLVGTDYSQNRVRVLRPDDASATGLRVHDIFPWRAPTNSGYPFVISGVGFGSLANTTVQIDGHAATLTSVTSRRITGHVPFRQDVPTQLTDVVVTVGGVGSDTLEDAFRWLHGQPGLELGTWQALTNVPVPLGEVSAAVIDGILYLVGEGSPTTQAYDLLDHAWLPAVATRPFPGHHHSAEVVDGKLYLIGGLSAGSDGKVQVYDPVLDSWSVGTDMPWGGGSVSTAVIDGQIHAAGGIVGTFTVNNNAVYDPVLDNWTALAPMPAKRNHAAAATDGAKLYVFGGRVGGNFVTNGYDDVQVYDPQTDTWSWSGAEKTVPKQTWSGARTAQTGAPASGPAAGPGGPRGSDSPTPTQIQPHLQPLPVGRGGTGKAVYWGGEFFVFGGETLDGPGAVAGNVYDRVDVFDPITRSWRLEAAMPIPRHGIAPVQFEGWIYLAGGGVNAGNSQSVHFDTFTIQ